MFRKIFIGLMIMYMLISLTLISGQVFAQSQSEPQRGGYLKIGTLVDATTLYPHGTISASDAMIMSATFEALVRYDDQGVPSPWLAEEWKVSSDKTYITVSLRKGVKFHDGVDFNAEAAKVNIDTAKATGLAAFKTIKSVEIVDDYTIKINLDSFVNTMISNLGRWTYMVSPKALKEHDEKWLSTHPVGTGPFKLVEWKRDSYQKYEPYDGYWQKGKPYLDGLEWVFIADAMTALASFKAGEVHMLLDVLPKHLADLEKSGKYRITKCPRGFLGFTSDGTTPGSPFADVRVRKAIQYALDKKAIASGLGFGYWTAIDQPARPGGWAESPDVVGYAYDPEKAKGLLKEAGYPKGFETKLFVANKPKDHVAAFMAVQNYLSDIGIQVEVLPVTRGRLRELVKKGVGWEKGLLWNGMGIGTTLDEMSMLYRNASQNSPSYRLIEKPDELENTLTKALASPDFDTKKKMAHEVMKLFVDKYSITTMLFSLDSTSVYYPKVHDVGIFATSRHQWTPGDAWMSK